MPVCEKLPAQSDEAYNPSEDLLEWMSRQFKRFGSIFRASAYGGEVYVVSDPGYVEYVLRDNWKNYKRGREGARIGMLVGNGLVVTHGEFWQTQRKLVQPAFHREAIAGYVDVITETMRPVLARWHNAALDKQSINITHEVSVWVLEVVLRLLFGSDYDRVQPHFSILSGEPARDLRFAQTFRSLRQLVRDVIHERLKSSTASHDMLGMLMSTIDAATGAPMPENQIISEMMTLVIAGHETTANVLTWVWYLLTQHPEVELKLEGELCGHRNEPLTLDSLPRFVWTRQVIEEVMRLYPPLWLITRNALKDDRLGNYFIPAGTEVYITPYLIQRSPDLWEDPDLFKPDRFSPDKVRHRHPLATLPFGAGPHKCIGELLARTEMQIHVMMVASQLRFRCVAPEPVELVAAVNLRNKRDFILQPEIAPA
jgi:cytochrome P450